MVHVLVADDIMIKRTKFYQLQCREYFKRKHNNVKKNVCELLLLNKFLRTNEIYIKFLDK